MNIAFVDCWSGVSGDMLLGALLDLGWPLQRLQAGLVRLPLDGYALASEPARRGSLVGTRFVIHAPPRLVHTPAGRTHGHGVLRPTAAPSEPGPLRGLGEIQELIRAAALPPVVTERALRAFQLLAEVEARAHGIALEQVHFHEVGAVDTLVDVCGVLLGCHELNLQQIYCSPVAVGSGTVRCAHGVLPVPAPATLGLLAGVPIVSGGLLGERATPTGAALLRVLVDQFAPAGLAWQPGRSGLGAGAYDDPQVPNLVRITVGTRSVGAARETVLELACQVDHVAGEVLGHAQDRLFAAGALDVVFVPAQMKKNRPGILVLVLVPINLREAIEAVLFAEIGTLGVRCAELTRTVLARRVETRATEFGPVRCKVRTLPDGRVEAVAEFEELRRVALAHRLPLREVAERVRRSLAEAGGGCSTRSGPS